MNKSKIKETVLRLIILFVGLTIAHLGVTLFLLANLGADPFNVLIQGLYRMLESISFLTHGIVHMTICFLIIIVLLIVDKTYIGIGTLGIGTLICAFVVGPVAGIFMPFNERLIKNVIQKLSK